MLILVNSSTAENTVCPYQLMQGCQMQQTSYLALALMMIDRVRLGLPEKVSIAR